MKIPIELKPAPEGMAPAVEYRWDPDTEILSAQLNPHQTKGNGMSGSLGVEGADGSWLILDVADGRINGVEIAVWPDVQKRNALAPPGSIEDAQVNVPSRASQPNVASMQVETALLAEADESERVFHFVLGKRRAGMRTVRCARDLLLDVDGSNHLAGVWLLNVPPFPSPS